MVMTNSLYMLMSAMQCKPVATRFVGFVGLQQTHCKPGLSGCNKLIVQVVADLDQFGEFSKEYSREYFRIFKGIFKQTQFNAHIENQKLAFVALTNKSVQVHT